jgi:hypothetical protein
MTNAVAADLMAAARKWEFIRLVPPPCPDSRVAATDRSSSCEYMDGDRFTEPFADRFTELMWTDDARLVLARGDAAGADYPTLYTWWTQAGPQP